MILYQNKIISTLIAFIDTECHNGLRLTENYSKTIIIKKPKQQIFLKNKVHPTHEGM